MKLQFSHYYVMMIFAMMMMMMSIIIEEVEGKKIDGNNGSICSDVNGASGSIAQDVCNNHKVNTIEDTMRFLSVSSTIMDWVPSLDWLMSVLWKAYLLFSFLFGLYALYAAYIFTIWKRNFASTRVNRLDEKSQSRGLPPKIKSFRTNKEKTLQNSKLHSAFDTCELLNDLEAKKIKNRVVKRTRVLDDADLVDKELNMDHVYIDFFDFLWGHIFVGPFSMYLWKKGTFILSVRQFLVKKGLLKVKKCDIETLIGKLCLEQSQVIHFYAKTKKDSELGNIAGFFFADFPYVDNNCDYQVADLFAVDIDLDTKKFVKAKMDDIELTASQTLILLWFNTIAAQHVKLHSLANWGVNGDESVKEIDPFFHQNSVVTVLYNYFGYATFSKFLNTWEEQGLLSKGWSEKNSLIKCFNHGIKENIWQHSHITELTNDSRLVNFIVKLRPEFFFQFNKYSHLFPGVDAEALFVGTILHSLDHTLMEWNLDDPLWLDINDPKFGLMAELGRIVRVGFVQDVPFLYFHKRFKGSGHPFYEAVYKKAVTINKELADVMDTCIIK